MNKYSLIVRGMRCAACSGAVNDTLKAIPNIEDVEVNLVTGTVEFSSKQKVNLDEIIAKINALGYEASVSKGASDAFKASDDFKLSELIILIILGTILLYISLANMVFTKNPPIPELFQIKQYPLNFLIIAGGCTIPIMMIGTKFYIPGLKSLFKGKPTMESLVSIGSLSAFLYSLYWTIIAVLNALKLVPCINATMMTIYDSACIVIVLVYLGKYIEQINNNKAKKEIKNLMEMLPTNANVLRDGKIVSVCINEVEVGETVIVKEGERIPVDGVVSSGTCIIDKSALTGESDPIDIKEDDEVLMGSIVLHGNIEVIALKLTKEATVNNILYLVSKAQISKSKKSQFIDKITRYFVPVVIAISLIVFVIWMIITSGDLSISINRFITTLVVACPCSIGLAIPLANVNLSTTAIKNGFVFRNTSVVNDIDKIDTFVFDKTGTLTDGKFKVEEIKNLENNNNIYPLIYSIESKSNHPIAKSICSYLEKENKGSLIENVEVETIPGLGLKGKIGDKDYYIVNSRFFKESESLDSELLYLSLDQKILASIKINDSIIEGADELISFLNKFNKEIYILTGDTYIKANRVAEQLGIKNVKAEVLPNEKYEFISSLKEQNKKICYIGDGINDAPSLSLSDLSISPYMSSDVASSSSDIYLLNPNLSSVIDIFGLSILGQKIINLNIIWAFAYNIIAMIFATGMFTSLGITFDPWMGALAMSISSICVVLTSLITKTYKSIRVKK